jgi:ABC-type uncharacterized transport system substrate-binding protein
MNMLFVDFARCGGLVDCGPDLQDLDRWAGERACPILGRTAAGNPLLQASAHSNLVLDLRVASALGFDFPALHLARASEVIE